VPCIDVCWASGRLKYLVTGAIDDVTLEMYKNQFQLDICHAMKET
jgi:hypothetical protein